jgi:hypothetical protein
VEGGGGWFSMYKGRRVLLLLYSRVDVFCTRLAFVCVCVCVYGVGIYVTPSV